MFPGLYQHKHAPSPGVTLRPVLGSGHTIDRLRILAGTTVGTTVYAIHRNEEYIPDTDNLHPSGESFSLIRQRVRMRIV